MSNTTTTAMHITPAPPDSSALSTLLSTHHHPHSDSQPTTALSLEILHNLRHQHSWADVRLHPPPRSNPSDPPIPLLSGLPPKPLYTHPDLQLALLRANLLPETSLAPEREFVIPTTVAKKWTLAELCGVFDSLPGRAEVVVSREGGKTIRHQDAKRVLLGMKAHEGVGGDGTVVYYIVQEGEVKPRQN